MNTSSAPISPHTTLADLATTRPGAARVFHRHSLDFCCHGQVSLERACTEKNLAVGEIVEELEREEQRAGDHEPWHERPLPQLVDHVLTRFHARHREQLPFLAAAARKVEAVHREKPDCPRGLAALLGEVAEELEEHMQKEEQVLFPLFLSGRGPMAGMPVQVMEQEHRDHALRLQQLRALAHDFVAPPEACGTWRALYLGLEDLERDLHQHIHLENNVLFPRALRG